MQLLPDSSGLPITQPPPAGHSAAAPHLLRKVLPSNSGPQHEQDPRKSCPVVERWSSPSRMHRTNRQERLDSAPKAIGNDRFRHGLLHYPFAADRAKFC
jgi:hypothetical protein